MENTRRICRRRRPCFAFETIKLNVKCFSSHIRCKTHRIDSARLSRSPRHLCPRPGDGNIRTKYVPRSRDVETKLLSSSSGTLCPNRESIRPAGYYTNPALKILRAPCGCLKTAGDCVSVDWVSGISVCPRRTPRPKCGREYPELLLGENNKIFPARLCGNGVIDIPT